MTIKEKRAYRDGYLRGLREATKDGLHTNVITTDVTVMGKSYLVAWQAFSSLIPDDPPDIGDINIRIISIEDESGRAYAKDDSSSLAKAIAKALHKTYDYESLSGPGWGDYWYFDEDDTEGIAKKMKKNIGYHAGDFKNKSENLGIGLHGTSFLSGQFYCLSKEACENQGAGFNREHPRPVYSFSLKGLNLFPTSADDCKTLNLFNKAMYYFPVWNAYYGDVDSVTFYKPLYRALQKCFEEFYADNVPEDERASKFFRELKDSYEIEANDYKEAYNEDYTFQDYIADTPCLKELQKCVRRIEPDAHNTLPYLSKLFLECSSFEEFENTMLNEYIKRKLKFKESCYGAKVSDIAATIGKDDFSNFRLGSKVVVNYNGKDHIRTVHDSPEGLKITVKGYPLYYEDFNYIDDEDFDDWYSNFDPAYQDFNSWYEFDRKSLNESKKFKEAKHYAVYTKVIGDRPYWMDETDSFNVDTKGDLILNLNELLRDAKDPNNKHHDVVIGISYIDDKGKGEYIPIDLDTLPRKYKPIILKEAKQLKESEEQDWLLDELDNFLCKWELAANIDGMFQKVADLLGISKSNLLELAFDIYQKYADLYDKVTGRFDNWHASEDDLFATQLLKVLGYDGTYPLIDADNTEWGGVIFDRENIENLKLV